MDSEKCSVLLCVLEEGSLSAAAEKLDYMEQHAENRSFDFDEGEDRDFGAEYLKKFEEAMDDDLNTADALGVIFSLVQDINVSLNAGSSLSVIVKAYETLSSITDVLGLLMQKAEIKLPDEIQALVDARVLARKNKDWKKSDEIRAELQQKGYIVEDTAQGQSVRRAIQ